MPRNDTLLSVAVVLFIAGCIGVCGGLALLPLAPMQNCVFLLSLFAFAGGGVLLAAVV